MSTVLNGIKGRKLSALRTRFWQYVHEDGRDHDLPPDVCWEWQGARSANGHPVISVQGRIRPARYIAYAIEAEDFDNSLAVVNTCSNVLCVNPGHLKLAERRPENDAPQELKVAAVAAVHQAVWQYEMMPQASTQACAECGRPAVDYHHHKGYEPEHWLDVTPLCRRCHRRAEWRILREVAPIYFT